MEKFLNVTLFHQIALQNLQHKNLGFSETAKSDDKGDNTAAVVQEVLKDGADGEAYLWRMYLTL